MYSIIPEAWNIQACKCLTGTVAHTWSGLEKSTHISMISNSVTHLRSYTNTTITDIAKNSSLISPMSPRRAPTSPNRAPISSH